MSIEILDCLKRKRDICVKAIITCQNRAFMLTPALSDFNYNFGFVVEEIFELGYTIKSRYKMWTPQY